VTRIDHAKAAKLLESIVAFADCNPIPAKEIKRAATKLAKLLTPPPTMGEILLQIPAQSHTARAKLIGLSRQGYYNLINDMARPNTMTAARLAELTGIPVETIRQVW
jgi:DNA-binding XRE family transcriptional regulator